MAYASICDFGTLSNGNYSAGSGYISSQNIAPKVKRSEFKRVNSRLKEWGQWRCKILEDSLGYPKQSTVVTALQGSHSTGPRNLPYNPWAEEIDKIVINQMRAWHPDWAHIVIIEYTTGGLQLEKIKLSGLKKSTYFSILDKARAWVEAKIKE